MYLRNVFFQVYDYVYSVKVINIKIVMMIVIIIIMCQHL